MDSAPHISLRMYLHYYEADPQRAQRLGALESQSFTLLHTALLLVYTQDLPFAAWQATCDALSRLAALAVSLSPTQSLPLGAGAPRFCGASFREASRAYPSWVPFCLAIETLVSILHLSMSVPATSAAVCARRLALILIVVFAEVAAHAHMQLMVPLAAWCAHARAPTPD